MTNTQDISDSTLQQATMTVLHQISEDFGSDICILDSTGNPMSDFKIQAILIFRSRFHVSRYKGNPKYKQSPSAWLIFTFQSTAAPLKDICCHPRESGVLAQRSCQLIHHQWSVDTVDTVSLGFFIGETPTYKLSSTFELTNSLI
jgi:hypothetical protein